jgi:hypothetical protein
MKCTDCSFINFDHLSKCRKCGGDLSAVRKELGLTDFRPNPPFLLKSLLEESEQPAAEISPGVKISAPGFPDSARTLTQDLDLAAGEARSMNHDAISWKVEESEKQSAVDPQTAKGVAALSVADSSSIPHYYIDDAELEELAENLSIIQSPGESLDTQRNAQSQLPGGMQKKADPFNLELESGSSAASTSEAEELLVRTGKQEIGLNGTIPRPLPEGTKGKSRG